ncbi:hypothetical protein AA23498_2706 [Acetobacter nitrogenifigens DSM 23921 = NBRC 105050]|uniref:Uncharacterized protein n=1 Tax=Acetobacter nitrogenifigens DSM 23921 = NBRC 105050 TaxID=1120919 RepID=A0A511XEW2_9PROT|nr:hypothetical protein AA23498_2706 [Acetobacter nitrogenifigens DSM 23921 = NBRC 105050]GEN61489.1 hypothetical protein ANI02nite_33730 [Acetobacter nitrogenifigens DSM 23921 = NBRC 105050]
MSETRLSPQHATNYGKLTIIVLLDVQPQLSKGAISNRTLSRLPVPGGGAARTEGAMVYESPDFRWHTHGTEQSRFWHGHGATGGTEMARTWDWTWHIFSQSGFWSHVIRSSSSRQQVRWGIT